MTPAARINHAERYELQLLERIDELDRTGAPRVGDAMHRLKQTDPTTYWTLYGALSRLVGRLDALEQEGIKRVLRRGRA